MSQSNGSKLSTLQITEGQFHLLASTLESIQLYDRAVLSYHPSVSRDILTIGLNVSGLVEMALDNTYGKYCGHFEVSSETTANEFLLSISPKNLKIKSSSLLMVDSVKIGYKRYRASLPTDQAISLPEEMSDFDVIYNAILALIFTTRREYFRTGGGGFYRDQPVNKMFLHNQSLYLNYHPHVSDGTPLVHTVKVVHCFMERHFFGLVD